MDDPNMWVQLADNLTLVAAMLFGLGYLVRRVDKAETLTEDRTQDIIEDWKRLRGIQDRNEERNTKTPV